MVSLYLPKNPSKCQVLNSLESHSRNLCAQLCRQFQRSAKQGQTEIDLQQRNGRWYYPFVVASFCVRLCRLTSQPTREVVANRDGVHIKFNL